MPLIPDADIGTEDLAAEGRGAGGYVQGLVTVKCHGQVRVDGTFGHLACVGVDAAGQVNCQHKCAVFPLAVYQCAGGPAGRRLPWNPVPYRASTTASKGCAVKAAASRYHAR